MVYSNLYSFSDLLTIFPFGKTKLRQLLLAGVLPVVQPEGHLRAAAAGALFSQMERSLISRKMNINCCKPYQNLLSVYFTDMMYNLKNEIYLLPSHPIVLPGYL